MANNASMVKRLLNIASAASSQPAGPLAAWRAQVAAGNLREDPAQAAAVAALQALHEALAKKRKRGTAPRGLYIWGEVGRGKSALMDLFFAHAPVKQKRRVHFHAFMQEVHARIHTIRQGMNADPVALLAEELAGELRLLCFDELQATDVADASLIFRLFDGLLARGVVLVATSNRPPAQLYTGGVQAERFHRLIALIETHMNVHALAGATDYRMEKSGARRHWFAPLSAAADAFLEHTWQHITVGSAAGEITLHIHGRAVRLRGAGRVLRASFAELCGQALGPADYLALANAADVLLLSGIPTLSPEKRNEAKRFVTLIDALYERRVALYATAEAEPAGLYPTGDGSFEFKRTVSRLTEMGATSHAH